MYFETYKCFCKVYAFKYWVLFQASTADFLSMHLNEQKIPCINFDQNVHWKQRENHYRQFVEGKVKQILKKLKIYNFLFTMHFYKLYFCLRLTILNKMCSMKKETNLIQDDFLKTIIFSLFLP